MLLVDTSAWGAAEWGLVASVAGILIAVVTWSISYRSGVRQGEKQEQAQQAEHERRDREEARTVVAHAEQAVQRFEQLEHTLPPQLAQVNTDLHRVGTKLTELETEVIGFRQELGTVRTAEALQFLLFSRRWRQAAASACRFAEGSPAPTKEITKVRDELTDRCGTELGIAAYQLPSKIAGLTGGSLELIQAAYQRRADTHLAGITFPVAVALHCIERVETRLCDLVDERKHPDLRASLEKIYVYAVSDYMRSLEQDPPAAAPPEPPPTTS